VKLYHNCPRTLRIQRDCCPRPPWCVTHSMRNACWASRPRRDPHRAASTEAPSSRTERARSIVLHGPTCTHACQVSSHMVSLSSTRHPRCTTWLSMPHCAHAHGARIELLCHPACHHQTLVSHGTAPRSTPCGRARTSEYSTTRRNRNRHF